MQDAFGWRLELRARVLANRFLRLVKYAFDIVDRLCLATRPRRLVNCARLSSFISLSSPIYGDRWD